VIGDRNHQIVRLDFNEDKNFPDTGDLLGEFEETSGDYDIVVVADYNKGFCYNKSITDFISICMNKNIPVLVDPKGTDWVKYSGASWITPNFVEFKSIINKKIRNVNEDIEKYIAEVSNTFGIDNVLVTRSEMGMSMYISSSGTIFHHKAKTQEVVDVSGAGDTVIAVLAAMLSSGADIDTAVSISNVAAGIAVGKSGTATVTRREIEFALNSLRTDKIATKIMDWQTLFNEIKLWKEKDMTIAVANGCFDIFHRGHAALLQTAASFCDKLIVAINSDSTVHKIKGDGRPINNEYDRAYVLSALEYVDAVVIFAEDTPEELLKHIMPDVLVKGAEYTLDQVPGRQYSKRVELVNYINGYSTTAIVNRSKGMNNHRTNIT
jgi:D-beta-D-heptose 7-phosphate kinase/D-beta-D-heptose 1-phosphate adenosyltransferase